MRAVVSRPSSTFTIVGSTQDGKLPRRTQNPRRGLGQGKGSGGGGGEGLGGGGGGAGRGCGWGVGRGVCLDKEKKETK